MELKRHNYENFFLCDKIIKLNSKLNSYLEGFELFHESHYKISFNTFSGRKILPPLRPPYKKKVFIEKDVARTDTERQAFITVLDFKLLSCKFLLQNYK